MRRKPVENSEPTTVTANLAGLLESLRLEDIVDLGDEIRARCPNNYRTDPKTGRPRHEENHPRHWSINKVTLQHFCFSCHYGGEIHQLVMDLTDKNLWEATQLIHKFGVSVGILSAIEETVFERPKDVSEFDLLHFPLPPDRAVTRRKLTLEAIRKFTIRWNPETSGWILPIRSPSGELWGWQEKMPDRVLNYPPRIKKSETLFGLNTISRADKKTLVLVESPLDVAYLHFSPSYPAVASFGSHVSDKQLDLILHYTDSVILALDNDASGIRETCRIIESGWHRNLRTFVLNYEGTEAKDPGEMDSDEIAYGIADMTDAAFWAP